MAKSFNLQDGEKFCIFVTKDKRRAIILTMSYIESLQVFLQHVIFSNVWWKVHLFPLS